MKTVEVTTGLTRAEQETVIRWDVEEQVVWIWTAEAKTIRKLARLGIEPHNETRSARTKGLTGKFYKLPLARFSWGLKAKRRELTEAERQVMRDRLNSLRRHSESL